ncbi:MAG: DHA2 family efflux MFS transporter permease subunit [Solirubrobacteraceae bacterium]
MNATEIPRRRRLLILAICCMSLLIVGLDTTVVNVALPSIDRSLHASLAGLQWVVDAYTLVLASLLMLSGSTGDRIGRRRVFQTGLLLFVLGSALCALAPTLAVLVGARALQAVGGSMLNPVAMSIIRNVFENPRERAQAVGMWSATIGISMGLGPVLGGILVDSAGWRYVFLINVPIGLTACLLTAIYVPESRAQHPRAIDAVGQALVLVGLASLTYAIIEGQGHGWTSAEILSLFALALVCFTVLVPYELRRREPLLNVRFFRSAPFAGASLAALFGFGSFGGFLFLNTLYLQDVRGLSAFDAGLCTLPIAAMTFLLAPLSGRIVAHRGTRLPLMVAALTLIASPLMLIGLSVHTPLALLIGSYLVFGIGFGMLNPPITNTAISGMPPAQAGVAAAVASASRSIGTTIGIAVLGAIAGAGAGAGFGPAFARATHPAWWLLAVLGALVLGTGIVSSTAWARRTALATAERLAEAEIALV